MKFLKSASYPRAFQKKGTMLNNGMAKNHTRITFLIYLTLLGIVLSGCGIKPSHLTPPADKDGKVTSTYPQVYPQNSKH